MLREGPFKTKERHPFCPHGRGQMTTLFCTYIYIYIYLGGWSAPYVQGFSHGDPIFCLGRPTVAEPAREPPSRSQALWFDLLLEPIFPAFLGRFSGTKSWGSDCCIRFGMAAIKFGVGGTCRAGLHTPKLEAGGWLDSLWHCFGAFCQGMLGLNHFLPTNGFSVLNHQ